MDTALLPQRLFKAMLIEAAKGTSSKHASQEEEPMNIEKRYSSARDKFFAENRCTTAPLIRGFGSSTRARV